MKSITDTASQIFGGPVTQRDSSIDFARGILIVMMVMFHIQYVGWAAPSHRAFIDSMHILRMPVFLVISGFLFRPLKTADKAYKNFRTIVIPYIIFLAAYLLALIVARELGIQSNNAPPESVQHFLSAIFIKPYGPYWFIHNIICLQIAFSVALIASGKLSESPICAFFGVLAIYMLVTMFTPLTVKMESIIFFTIGWLLREIRSPLPQNPAFAIALLLSGIAMLSAGGTYEVCQALLTIGALGLILFIGKLVGNSGFGNAFAWLGQNTLVIVLLHPAFLMVAKVVSPVSVKVDASGFLHAAIATGIGVGGPIALGIVFDRMRVSNLLFGKPKITASWTAKGEPEQRVSIPA